MTLYRCISKGHGLCAVKQCTRTISFHGYVKLSRYQFTNTILIYQTNLVTYVNTDCTSINLGTLINTNLTTEHNYEY